MNTRHLVDPDLLPIIDAVPTVDFSKELLPAIRATSLPIQVQNSGLGQVQLLRQLVPRPAGAPEVEIALYRPQVQSAVLPDDRTCVSPPHPYAGEFIWTPISNHFGWSSLLGCAPGSDNVAAARAEDLSGLPPTFISTGALDLFIEEDIEYARRLMRAGVPVELHVYPGAFHGFDFLSTCAVSTAAQHASLAALRRFTTA